MEFENSQEPLQTCFFFLNYCFHQNRRGSKENEIKKLLAKNVIEPVQDSEGKFVSLIFLRLKKRWFF